MITYRHECAVRFDDLDSYGHVNNVTFAEYLQEARVAFARHVLDETPENERYVVVRQSIDYRAPVGFRTDPLAIDMWVTKLGTSSFTAAYRIHDNTVDDAVYVSAQTVLVAVDPRMQRHRPLGDRERHAIEAYLEERP